MYRSGVSFVISESSFIKERGGGETDLLAETLHEGGDQELECSLGVEPSKNRITNTLTKRNLKEKFYTHRVKFYNRNRPNSTRPADKIVQDELTNSDTMK